MSQVGSVGGLQEQLDGILFLLLEAKRNGGTQNCPPKWTNGGTVHRTAKLMREYIDAAVQFDRPISLYTVLIFPVAAVLHLLYEPAFYRDVRSRAPS